MHTAYGARPFLHTEGNLVFSLHHVAAFAAGLGRILCRHFHVFLPVKLLSVAISIILSI